MATLLPADFDMKSVRESEQVVIRRLVEGLDESWWVVPSIRFRRGVKDIEVDVLVTSRRHGGIVIETKGGAISRVDGNWMQYDRHIGSPIEQVIAAKHGLVTELKRRGVDLDGLYLRHVVAFPDLPRTPAGGFGLDAPDSDVWSASELREPIRAIERLVIEHEPIPEERFVAFLHALKPSVAVEIDHEAETAVDLRRLDDATMLRLEAMASLDVGQRVLVTGAAGSGKSWLVAEWARRAAARGERVAVVCFNLPISDQLRNAIGNDRVIVRTYHDLVRDLLGPLGWTVPDLPTTEFWEHAPTRALTERIGDVGTRFDTIIVDEGQDIRPHWLTSLELLLDPDGPGRLLMVADPAQAIYTTGWLPPVQPSAHLNLNLRNTGSIGGVVERLGGAPVASSSPVGHEVRTLLAGGKKEMRKRVRDEVARLVTEEGLAAEEIAVLTTRSAPRDALFADPPDGVQLARWEAHGPGSTLCETVHRTKGLEWLAVVLVDMSDDVPDERLLYIGTSRARAHLRIIGNRNVAAACGIDPGATRS